MFDKTDLPSILNGNTFVITTGDGVFHEEMTLDNGPNWTYIYDPLIKKIEAMMDDQGYQIVYASDDPAVFNEYYTTYITLMRGDVLKEYLKSKYPKLPICPHVANLASFSERYANSKDLIHIVVYDS